jgi:general secretion pathway protein N
MTATVRGLLFAALLAIAIIAQFPLRLAGLDRVGVTARAARGTVWQGQLDDASLRGMPLGDVQVGLSPAALLTGGLRLDFAGARLKGALVRRAGGLGLAGVAGSVGPLQIGGLPIDALTFDTVDIGFAERRCVTASGSVRLQPAAGLGVGDSLVGAPRCDGTAVVLPLASASGKERLELRVEADRRYRATLALDDASVAQRPLLLAAGFQPTPSGLAMTVEGVF